MMKTEPIGLYIHIPFCIKKCNYCDFCSFSNLSDIDRKSYINTLIKEIRSYKREEKISVDTIFFGGGTPSLLSFSEFSDIINAVNESFNVFDGAEFTVEINPKTVDADKLKVFVSAGVNRISIGMQTIHENEYKILGRIHDFNDFSNAYELVLKSGITNINIDVMYGIPTQTQESFCKTLSTVISFKPTHISMYGLILEEGTPLYEARSKLLFPDEDTECLMYRTAAELLADNGYLHYEISNYSLPGFESKHNLKYWRNKEYIGLGVSAYSFFENKRYGNTCALSVYLSSTAENYIYEESIDIKTSAFEHVMLGLRLSEGISLSEYKKLYGVDFISGREEKINLYIKEGYMLLSNDRLSLTEQGFYVSNAILAELI